MFDGADLCPVDCDRLFEKCFVADVTHFAGPNPVFVNEASCFYVEAAVFGDLGLLALSPPLDRLHPRGGLFHSTSCLGYRIQSNAVFDPFLEADHKVERRNG